MKTQEQKRIESLEKEIEDIKKVLQTLTSLLDDVINRNNLEFKQMEKVKKNKVFIY